MKIFNAAIAHQNSQDTLNKQWENFLESVGSYISHATDKGEFSCKIPISDIDYQKQLFQYLITLGYQVEVSEERISGNTGDKVRDFIIKW